MDKYDIWRHISTKFVLCTIKNELIIQSYMYTVYASIPLHDVLVRIEIYFVREEINFITNEFYFVINEIKMFTNEINFITWNKRFYKRKMFCQEWIIIVIFFFNLSRVKKMLSTMKGIFSGVKLHFLRMKVIGKYIN